MPPSIESLPENSQQNNPKNWRINLRRFYYLLLVILIGFPIYIIPLYLFSCGAHVLGEKDCNMGYSGPHQITTPNIFTTMLNHYFLPIACGFIIFLTLAIVTSYKKESPSKIQKIFIFSPLIFIGTLCLFSLIFLGI